MKRIAGSLLIMAVAALTPAPANADTLYVPGDYPTIQGAIDAADEGDEIIVSPGTYVENIHFDGKNVAVRAVNPSVELADPMDPGVASIIDGSQPTDPDFGSVVRFSGTEDPTCTLDGFTVTGGTGIMGQSGFTEGGGLFGGEGGAPWVWTQAGIVNCTVTGNTARFGAGLSQCGGTIANCKITGNWTADPGGSNHGGGGLAACNGTIRNCAITGNTATEGGALYSCRGLIIDCDITGNEVVWSGGAMIYCDDATLVNCNLSGNTASLGGFGAGGAVFSSRTTYLNCTLANNTAKMGGAIYAYHSFAPTMSNCVIWGNTATGGNGPQIALNSTGQPTTLVIEYSDLQGGQADIWLGDPGNCFIDWGAGMIEADPLFADPGSDDYRLSAGSPCIDSGRNNAVPPDVTTDLDGNPRFVNDPAPDCPQPDADCGTPPIVDMGPYEVQEVPCPADLNGDGQVGAFDLALLLGAWGPNPGHPADFDGDGAVGAFDLAILLGAWGPCE